MVIYKTTNLINGKFYIGKDAKNNPNYLGSGSLLKEAIRKYGKNNFKKEILESCKNQEELYIKERYWIEELDSQNPNVGYNILRGGLGGMFYTKQIESKISEFLKQTNKNYSAEELANLKDIFIQLQKQDIKKRVQRTKKAQTPEQKLNIYIKYYISKTGVEPTEEQKKLKLQQYTFGKPPKKIWKHGTFLGKRHTEETKEKLRLARLGKSSWNKGKKMSIESRQKLSLAKKGKKRGPLSEEHKNKIKEALKKVKRTPEHQAAINASLKGKKAWNKGIKMPVESLLKRKQTLESNKQKWLLV
jgi:hypothetical protein